MKTARLMPETRRQMTDPTLESESIVTTVNRSTPPLPYSGRPALHLVPAAETTERSLLELLPPVPLPARLSPRRLPRTVRARNAIRQLVRGTTADRAFLLLAVAVAGAVIAGLYLMQARYGIDTSAVSR